MTEDGRGPLYMVIIETVLQKNESLTFASLNPNNLSSFKMEGGTVFGKVIFGFSTGNFVTKFTGS